MTGAPLEAARHGLRALVADLRGDARAVASAWLSVIEFGSAARCARPLAPLGRFVEPALVARGTSALGAALRLLRERVSAERARADLRPLVVLLTDGEPTDDWEAQARALRESRALGRVVGCVAAGGDLERVRPLCDDVVELERLEPDAFRRFLSPSPGAGGADDDPDAIPPPPSVVYVVP
jgi:uncharacterized protein YegL